MADRYQQLVNTPIGKLVTKQVGLPSPVKLERYEPGQPVISGPVLFGAAPGGRLSEAVDTVLRDIGADVATGEPESVKALVYDATGIGSSEELRQVRAFFQPIIRSLQACGRVIVLGATTDDPRAEIAQRALEGLVRSIGKEAGKGSTAQLIYVAPDADGQLDSTLRFFLSPKSAYVSGQVVRIGEPVASYEAVDDWERPLAGKVALVTGAARGIGASIAEVLARDGAHVVGLDVPGQEASVELRLDITAEDAPARIASHLLDAHGGVDVVVHNAGVTRDKRLGGMREELWELVLGVNLIAPQRIDQELFARKAVRANGRIVCVSSISGIAGNAGQTNYSTSKAGVIGIVRSFSPILAKQGVTVNAVAPGFIETQMTAAMPITLREAGRRMNSMSQGGLPVDVAETIAWFASPASAGLTGNVVRVCGQSLLGA